MVADGKVEWGLEVSGGDGKEKLRAGDRFVEQIEFLRKGLCGSDKLECQA